MNSGTNIDQDRALIRAAAIADGDGKTAAPGAILIEGGRIIEASTPQAIGQPGDCRIIDLPQSVVIPGLVNAHCHLDLSHIGPLPFTGDFTSWVAMVRANRAMTDEAIDAAVRRGIELAIAGGTRLIGDIAGVASLQPLRTLRQSSLAGVSYFEVFGLGAHQPLAIERMRHAIEQERAERSHVRLGLQPHAPYSCGLDVFRAAAAHNVPLATHLAETLEEIEFVQRGTGAIQRMLQRLGVWDESILPAALHPIDHLAPILRETPFIVAHMSYIDDAHLELISRERWPISIAYCPRASAYFGHPARGYALHRYREMLDAGMNVAIGTDSILCLDTPDRISVWDEMRLLHQRDGTDPFLLLRMATVNGAKALGFDAAEVTLAPRAPAQLLAIDVPASAKVAGQTVSSLLSAALVGTHAPHWVSPSSFPRTREPSESWDA